MQPNLFIVGAPKCGTTAWVEFLRSHPQIFFPAVKEPYHFCSDLSPSWRMTDRAEYLRLFNRADNSTVLGDASVWYLLSEVAARNIHSFNPEAKIIILLRDQEDQLPSLHNQLLFNGIENIRDFQAAWAASARRDSSNMPPRSMDPALLDYRKQGRFSPQIERYFAEFPSEQIRVFHFNDWTRHPRSIYLEILDFLAIPDDGRTEFPQINEATHHRIGALGRFTQLPPTWALKASSLVKKVTRRTKPPLVDWLRGLNTVDGYRTTPLTDAFKREIREYYAEDNAQVERRVWRPPGEHGVGHIRAR